MTKSILPHILVASVLSASLSFSGGAAAAGRRHRKARRASIYPAWVYSGSQELSLESILEDETSDVEVCQAATCDQMRREILVEASKCQRIAPFKQRRGRVRGALARNSCMLYRENNFRSSKGRCAAAVKSAAERSGVDAHILDSNAFDLQKKGAMERAGFVNLRWKYDERTAPLGSILTYVGGVGHHYGHIEVRVNPNLFCSDHCNPRAVTAQSEATRERYKLVGVYLPFSASIQANELVEQAPPRVN